MRRQVDLTSPQSVAGIVRSALTVLGSYPGLFLALALAVVAPYDLIVLAATGVTPLGAQTASAGTTLTVLLLYFVLIVPLMSALYVLALATLAHGERPALRDVVWQGARVLPVVAAAQIVAGIGIGLGLVFFVIPGVLLAIHWAVVAQTAAIERTDWMGALRRSGQLARGQYIHILGVLFLTYLINYAVVRGAAAAVGSHRTSGQVALGIAVDILTRSVAAIITSVLYFDLLARRGERLTPA